MKIFKADTQSLILKPLGIHDKLYLVTTVLVFYDLLKPDVPLKEQNLWQTVPALLGREGVLDQGMAKPCGETVIMGSCFSPQRVPVGNLNVSIKVGNMEKTLAVFGDRFWVRNSAGFLTISDPLPFTEMPLIWQNAFGGAGFKENPEGKGITPAARKDGNETIPLPNVEYPEMLIGAPSDHPDPAGFGPIDMLSPQRSRKQGTYDEKWFNERWPYFPDDMDYEFFNVASKDQFIEGFFHGGEPVDITHMHPDMPDIRSHVPRLRMRCFVTKKTTLEKHKHADEIFQEVTTRIDTVWLFPSALRGVVMYRGLTEVLDEEYADIVEVFVSSENIDEPPKTIDYYLEEQKKAFDRSVPAMDMNLDDVRKDVEDTLKKVKNMPKRIETAKLRAMGKAPVMPTTPQENILKGKQVIANSMIILDNMEKMVLDMKAKFGPYVRADMKKFAAMREKLTKTSARLDEIMSEVQKGQAQGDEAKKEISGILKKHISPEELEKSGIDPDSPIKAEMVNPWHDAGFPLVVEWRKRLEKDEKALSILHGLGFADYTIEGAWLGVNDRERHEEATFWGLKNKVDSQGAEREITIPPGLVMPRFTQAMLTRILIRHEDWSRAGHDVLVEGSGELPLFLHAVEDEGAPVVRVSDELEAYYVEQEIGDACSVIALGNPTEKPDEAGTKAIKSASVFLIIVPESLLPKESDMWLKAYPQSKIIPLPEAGTVFEARRNGVDIRRLIMKALPMEFAKKHNIELALPEVGEPSDKSPTAGLAIPVSNAAAIVDQFTKDINAHLQPEIDEAMKIKEEAERRAADKLTKLGKDPADVIHSQEELSKKSLSEIGRDVSKEVDAVRERLKGQGLLTPEHEQKLKETSAMASRMGEESEARYKEGIARLDEAKKEIEKVKAGELPDDIKEQLKAAGIDPERIKKLTREEAIERYRTEKSLAGAILSGVDLSGLDLQGVDLSEVFCQKTNFSGSNLNKAILLQTVATEADFSGASLAGSSVKKAVLTKAILKGSCLTDAQIDSTILQGTDLTEADLSRTHLNMSILTEAKLVKTVFTNVRADLTVFNRSDASNALFKNARFFKCVFQDAALDGADFSSATIDSTMFSNARGEKVKFTGADMSRGNMGGGTAFPGADFQNVKMLYGYLCESDLSGADFRGAILDFSMLESCNLAGVNLSKISAKQTRFIKSDMEGADLKGINLFLGSLRKTRLVKADLKGANLFGVDLYKAIVGKTGFENANMKRTLLNKKVDLLE